MTEKCQSFFLFQKDLNKTTWKINSYFSTITQILNTSKAERAVHCVTRRNAFKYCRSSFCADTEHNNIGVVNPRLASHMPLIAQFHEALKAEVPLHNKHKNKRLVKFCHCHIDGVWYLQ